MEWNDNNVMQGRVENQIKNNLIVSHLETIRRLKNVKTTRKQKKQTKEKITINDKI